MLAAPMVVADDSSGLVFRAVTSVHSWLALMFSGVVEMTIVIFPFEVIFGKFTSSFFNVSHFLSASDMAKRHDLLNRVLFLVIRKSVLSDAVAGEFALDLGAPLSDDILITE